MSYQLTMNNLNEVINEQIATFYSAFHEVYTQPDTVLDATVLSLPERFGVGQLDIRKTAGITFSTMSLSFNNDVRLIGTTLDSAYFIGVNLGADLSFETHIPKRTYHFPAQSLSFGYNRAGEELHTLLSSNRCIRTINFALSEQQLRQYLADLNEPDMPLVDVNEGMKILKQMPMSARHSSLIARLVDNPYRGALGKLHFDSIAGELLISLLESLFTHKGSTSTLKLAQRDKEQLLAARQLLLADLHNPPTIAQLANVVGMNEDKLKKGFKVAFNNTVFKTLSEHRMQLAVKHVRANDLSIAEIAYETGYENVSKFIAAFKKAHGITPGVMRKEIR